MMAKVSPLFLGLGIWIALTISASDGKSVKQNIKEENGVLKAAKPPIVLVPGDGGSQFEASIDKPSVVHIWCTKKAKWFSLWLNLEQLAPYVIDCFVDNMKLQYDRKTHTTRNMPGVQTRQPGFGNTSSVEWLDPSQLSPTSYYNPIVNALIEWGWTRNVNIRGAPYDFRKAPNEMHDYIKNLVSLIEETYRINDKERVILIGHSMGNPYILYMLNHQSQKWKDQYIHSHIALSGPWGGAAKTLRLMASGDNLGVFVVNPLSARPQQRSMPSTAWLLPYDTFWDADEVIVFGPKRNYTVKDYPAFFKDIDYKTGLLMRQDTEGLIKELKAPGVTVHCLHGIDVKTPAQFHYTKSQWYDSQPDVTYKDGDGTVNKRSLYGCLRWRKAQKQEVYHQEFSGVDHMKILGNKGIIDYVEKVVKNKL